MHFLLYFCANTSFPPEICFVCSFSCFLRLCLSQQKKTYSIYWYSLFFWSILVSFARGACVLMRVPAPRGHSQSQSNAEEVWCGLDSLRLGYSHTHTHTHLYTHFFVAVWGIFFIYLLSARVVSTRRAPLERKKKAGGALRGCKKRRVAEALLRLTRGSLKTS